MLTVRRYMSGCGLYTASSNCRKHSSFIVSLVPELPHPSTIGLLTPKVTSIKDITRILILAENDMTQLHVLFFNDSNYMQMPSEMVATALLKSNPIKLIYH